MRRVKSRKSYIDPSVYCRIFGGKDFCLDIVNQFYTSLGGKYVSCYHETRGVLQLTKKTHIAFFPLP